MKNYNKILKEGSSTDAYRYFISNDIIEENVCDKLVGLYIEKSNDFDCYKFLIENNDKLSDKSKYMLKNRILGSKNFGVKALYKFNFEELNKKQKQEIIDDILDFCDNKNIEFFLNKVENLESNYRHMLSEKESKNEVEFNLESLIDSIIKTNDKEYIKSCLDRLEKINVSDLYLDKMKKSLFNLKYGVAKEEKQNHSVQEIKHHVSFNYAMKRENLFAIFNYMDTKKNIKRDKMDMLVGKLANAAAPYVIYEFLGNYYERLDNKDIEKLEKAILNPKENMPDKELYKYLYLVDFKFLTSTQKDGLVDEVIETLNISDIKHFILKAKNLREKDLLKLKKKLIIDEKIPNLISSISKSNNSNYIKQSIEKLEICGIDTKDMIELKEKQYLLENAKVKTIKKN